METARMDSKSIQGAEGCCSSFISNGGSTKMPRRQVVPGQQRRVGVGERTMRHNQRRRGAARGGDAAPYVFHSVRVVVSSSVAAK